MKPLKEETFKGGITFGSEPVNVVKVPDQNKIAIGLTKREYFAAMVLQGMLANQSRFTNPVTTAGASVLYADALIAALNKESEANNA